MTREEQIRIDQGNRLKDARLAAGYRSAAAAAAENEWPESTYRAHEGGTRTMGLDDAERYAKRFRAEGVDITAQTILFDSERAARDAAAAKRIVSVVGFVGAGAEILPEFEQVPADGLEQIELPFDVPEDLAALRVVGDSMVPAYKDGDAILVWKEQRRPSETFYGEEAAVRTIDGRRYLKEIQHGRNKQVFDLYSHNARLIRDVRLDWIGEIYIIVRSNQIRRATASKKASVSRKAKKRAEETAGMSELPLHGRR